jgi:hypothetical protein
MTHTWQYAIKNEEWSELVTLDNTSVTSKSDFRLGKVVSDFGKPHFLFKARVFTQSKCFMIHLEIILVYLHTRERFGGQVVRCHLMRNTDQEGPSYQA